MAIVIRAFGKAVPERRVYNNELPAELETNDEWIRSHTGIGSRYIAGENESCISLGVEACKQAVKVAGINPEDLKLLICSTTTPAFQGFPSTACLMQPSLGAVNATCFDITAACTGFLYALNNAAALMEMNCWKYALLCGSEILTSLCDWKDRSTCVLFGDGAGAVVLERVENNELNEVQESDGISGVVGSFVSGSDGSGAEALYMSPEDGFMKMDGHSVYNFAVGAMANAIRLVMDKENLTEDDVDYFVCHQANERIISAAAKRLGYDGSKFVCSMGEYGNTSSASIPITLSDMDRQGLIRKGTTVVSAAFGAGLTWAGTAIRF